MAWSLGAVLLVCSWAWAQQAAHEFRGTWTATAGTVVLRGTWTAESAPRKPNAAHGTWTLLGETDEVALEGTWSAEKTGRGWEGSWTARVRHGRTYSGAWQADIAAASSKTFADMLGQAAKKEIAGSWQSGRYRGNWWLQSEAAPGRR
jgi:hypothetical protein